MRISSNEILKIKDVLNEFQLLPSCKIFLFGSRLYDDKKGGDIDLVLLCHESSYKNLLDLKYRIKSKLEFALNEQRVDLTYNHNRIHSEFRFFSSKREERIKRIILSDLF